MLFPPNDSAGAIFSDCRRYRYRLWRVWDASKPRCHFTMLNGSKAGEDDSDNTVTRCINFARDWGFGRLDVTNAHPLMSTDPKKLYVTDIPDEQYEINDRHILDAFNESKITVCAWGNHGEFKNRFATIEKAFRERDPLRLYHLGLTKEGQPRHPLYTKSDLKPILWE